MAILPTLLKIMDEKIDDISKELNKIGSITNYPSHKEIYLGNNNSLYEFNKEDVDKLPLYIKDNIDKDKYLGGLITWIGPSNPGL